MLAVLEVAPCVGCVSGVASLSLIDAFVSLDERGLLGLKRFPGYPHRHFHICVDDTLLVSFLVGGYMSLNIKLEL